ncbi:UNVERIFIED_CONTAM: hypothetical protein PYX00_009889 [Menopon gallinae]|uniref:DRBM domain-containing protein n=1 Tax=Menopon gallinae TaxID=328185 RepID=A0AAW2HD15_9NEOP
MQNTDDISLSDISFDCDNAAADVPVTTNNTRGNGEQKSESFDSYNFFSELEDFIDYVDQSGSNTVTCPVQSKSDIPSSNNESQSPQTSTETPQVKDEDVVKTNTSDEPNKDSCQENENSENNESNLDTSQSDQEEKEKTEHTRIKVRSEEEMKLREFVVLDEVGPYDEDGIEGEGGGPGGGGFADDDYDDDDFDVSDTEIHAMLEEALEPPKKKLHLDTTESEDKDKKEVKQDQDGYVENEKVVMVEKVKDHFEVLPDGWVTLTHNSGMPLYLHRTSRVCTLSKPYFLGPGSARKHAIPLSAVPCLEYRRAKEEEEKKKEDNQKSNTLIVNGTEIPSARVETVQENEQSRQLTPLQFREYCQNLFEFQTIKVIRFKSWLARRKFTKERNVNLQRPTLPKDTKLITCPIKTSTVDGKAGRAREWIMNPNGKSYVCILHEYIQRALKDQPVYTFKELENTATPYLAIVSIGNVQYGTGYGTSKKQAKHDAAKATLEILIPEMKDKIEQDEKASGRAGNRTGQTDLSFFDGIKIEDPRVTELCVKTTEPLPHAILLTCLQRNFGLSEMNIKYETTPLKHSKNEFTMTVGNHTAKVICQNKRDGKQKAAQAILKALHPHIPSWGSLLRLYGNTSVKTMKEKKIEEQEITLLQNRGTSHSPNYAILNKLKEEMKKFKAMKTAIKPIGKFIPPDDVELPTESSSELRNVVI